MSNWFSLHWHKARWTHSKMPTKNPAPFSKTRLPAKWRGCYSRMAPKFKTAMTNFIWHFVGNYVAYEVPYATSVMISIRAVGTY